MPILAFSNSMPWKGTVLPVSGFEAVPLNKPEEVVMVSVSLLPAGTETRLFKPSVRELVNGAWRTVSRTGGNNLVGETEWIIPGGTGGRFHPDQVAAQVTFRLVGELDPT